MLPSYIHNCFLDLRGNPALTFGHFLFRYAYLRARSSWKFLGRYWEITPYAIFISLRALAGMCFNPPFLYCRMGDLRVFVLFATLQLLHYGQITPLSPVAISRWAAHRRQLFGRAPSHRSCLLSLTFLLRMGYTCHIIIGPQIYFPFDMLHIAHIHLLHLASIWAPPSFA